MENLVYRLEPAEHAVYKVQENCCYTKVVYQGPKLGIYPRFDRENEEIGLLMCGVCDPARKIEDIPKEFFEAYYKIVKKTMAKA